MLIIISLSIYKRIHLIKIWNNLKLIQHFNLIKYAIIYSSLTRLIITLYLLSGINYVLYILYNK